MKIEAEQPTITYGLPNLCSWMDWFNSNKTRSLVTEYVNVFCTNKNIFFSSCSQPHKTYRRRELFTCYELLFDLLRHAVREYVCIIIIVDQIIND